MCFSAKGNNESSDLVISETTEIYSTLVNVTAAVNQVQVIEV